MLGITLKLDIYARYSPYDNAKVLSFNRNTKNNAFINKITKRQTIYKTNITLLLFPLAHQVIHTLNMPDPSTVPLHVVQSNHVPKYYDKFTVAKTVMWSSMNEFEIKTIKRNLFFNSGRHNAHVTKTSPLYLSFPNLNIGNKNISTYTDHRLSTIKWNKQTKLTRKKNTYKLALISLSRSIFFGIFLLSNNLVLPLYPGQHQIFEKLLLLRS